MRTIILSHSITSMAKLICSSNSMAGIESTPLEKEMANKPDSRRSKEVGSVMVQKNSFILVKIDSNSKTRYSGWAQGTTKLVTKRVSTPSSPATRQERSITPFSLYPTVD